MNDPQIHKTHAEELLAVLDENVKLKQTLQERSYLHPMNMESNIRNIQALLPGNFRLHIGKEFIVLQNPDMNFNETCRADEVQTILFAMRIKADEPNQAQPEVASNTGSVASEAPPGSIIAEGDARITSALKVQEGGSHYKDLAIQPVEYNHKNRIGFIEGCVIKYVTRWRDKGGLQDLRKARHFLDLLIELETPSQA